MREVFRWVFIGCFLVIGCAGDDNRPIDPALHKVIIEVQGMS